MISGPWDLDRQRQVYKIDVRIFRNFFKRPVMLEPGAYTDRQRAWWMLRIDCKAQQVLCGLLLPDASGLECEQHKRTNRNPRGQHGQVSA